MKNTKIALTIQKIVDDPASIDEALTQSHWMQRSPLGESLNGSTTALYYYYFHPDNLGINQTDHITGSPVVSNQRNNLPTMDLPPWSKVGLDGVNTVESVTPSIFPTIDASGNVVFPPEISDNEHLTDDDEDDDITKLPDGSGFFTMDIDDDLYRIAQELGLNLFEIDPGMTKHPARFDEVDVKSGNGSSHAQTDLTNHLGRAIMLGKEHGYDTKQIGFNKGRTFKMTHPMGHQFTIQHDRAQDVTGWSHSFKGHTVGGSSVPELRRYLEKMHQFTYAPHRPEKTPSIPSESMILDGINHMNRVMSIAKSHGYMIHPTSMLHTSMEHPKSGHSFQIYHSSAGQVSHWSHHDPVTGSTTQHHDMTQLHQHLADKSGIHFALGFNKSATSKIPSESIIEQKLLSDPIENWNLLSEDDQSNLEKISSAYGYKRSHSLPGGTNRLIHVYRKSGSNHTFLVSQDIQTGKLHKWNHSHYAGSKKAFGGGSMGLARHLKRLHGDQMAKDTQTKIKVGYGSHVAAIRDNLIKDGIDRDIIEDLIKDAGNVIENLSHGTKIENAKDQISREIDNDGVLPDDGYAKSFLERFVNQVAQAGYVDDLQLMESHRLLDLQEAAGFDPFIDPKNISENTGFNPFRDPGYFGYGVKPLGDLSPSFNPSKYNGLNRYQDPNDLEPAHDYNPLNLRPDTYDIQGYNRRDANDLDGMNRDTHSLALGSQQDLSPSYPAYVWFGSALDSLYELLAHAEHYQLSPNLKSEIQTISQMITTHAERSSSGSAGSIDYPNKDLLVSGLRMSVNAQPDPSIRRLGNIEIDKLELALNHIA